MRGGKGMRWEGRVRDEWGGDEKGGDEWGGRGREREGAGVV